MKKSVIITSILLIIAGLITFIVSFSTTGFNWKSLSNEGEYILKTASYDVCEKIEVDITTEDMKIVPSSDDKINITYYENNLHKYTSNLKENTLSFEEIEQDNIFNFNIFNFFNNIEYPIIIAVPQSFIGTLDLEITTADVYIDIDNQLKDVEIELTTGDLTVKNLKADNLNIELTTGDINVSNVSINNQYIQKITTGDSQIRNLKANVAKIKASTGDIEFNNIDANELYIEATTGDVEGRLNYKINEYTITSVTTTGSNNLPKYYKEGSKILNVKTTTGDVEVDFAR